MYKKIITELIRAASNLLGTIRVFHQRVSHLPIVDDSVAELRRNRGNPIDDNRGERTAKPHG
jgi:hypothetical protein